VEPTSVTPFSSPLRERALHAILIGLVRLFSGKESYKDPRKLPSDQDFERIFDIIKKRVMSIDKAELVDTEKHLYEIVENWRNWNPEVYEEFFGDRKIPLMYPSGSIPNVDWNGCGLPTPTSMRNVDSECEIAIITKYNKEEE
jgi:hypothetical protein